ncbi:MAG: dephospho-CoA kinase [Acutalibacteraceae bacterium]
MNKTIIVGLTGTSGAGKTTVCEILRQHGCMIINSDIVAREITEIGSPCLDELRLAFSDEIINADGSLNRRGLGEIAFSSDELTERLNAITHPHIIKRIKSIINKYKQGGAKIIILDAPQLFEANADTLCDCIVAVIADRRLAKDRIISRDNIDENNAENRLSRSHDDGFFIARADYIIRNDADFNTLKINVSATLEKIVSDFNI